MPLLSAEEAYGVSDAFLLFLYGEDLFWKWKEMKDAMQFISERDYISWLLEVAMHYRDSGDVREEMKYDNMSLYNEGELERESVQQGVHARKTTHRGAPSSLTTRQLPPTDYMGDESVKSEFESSNMSFNNSDHNIQNKGVNPEPNQFETEEILVSDDDYDASGSVEVGVGVRDVAAPSREPGTLAGASAMELAALVPGSGSASVSDRGAKTGRERYACVHCDYACSIRSNMEKHMRSVHEKSKPFHCDHCAYSCSTKPNLKSHLVSKHGYTSAHLCPSCKKYFASPSALEGHVKCCKFKGSDS